MARFVQSSYGPCTKLQLTYKVGVWYKKSPPFVQIVQNLYRSRHKLFAMDNSGPKNEGANNGFFCQGKMAFMAGVWYTVLKAFDVFQLLTHSKPAKTSSMLFLFVPKSLPGASRYVAMRYLICKYCRSVFFKGFISHYTIMHYVVLPV